MESKKLTVKDQILKALEAVTGVKNPNLEFSAREDFGDFSSNVALQMGKQAGLPAQSGNFLENIEWILREVKKDNWHDNEFNLPVGRLNPEVKKLINAKSDLVYLNGFIYAKINGWLGHRAGHKEVLNVLRALPYITFYPINIYADSKNDLRNLFSFDLGKFGVAVIEIMEEKSRNEIVTIFFVNPKRLKKGILGKYRISSLQAPVKAAGASFSGLQESQLFYNKLQTESQGKFSLNYELKQNPATLAEEIADKINNMDGLPFIAKAMKGFVNFWIKNDILIDNLIQIDNDYGKSNINNKKLVIVEYSSPNIAKPFTVGHLRSTIIGGAIANLLEATGHKVLRDNHLGDWGTQFGTLLTQVSKIPNYKLKITNWDVKYLVSLYIKFHKEAEEKPELKDEARAWFKKLEDGDKDARFIWQKCIEVSFKEFDAIYKKLGVKFSHEFNEGRGLGESFFESRMGGVIAELEKKKLLKVGKEGAKLVFFNDPPNGEASKYPPAMIIKSDGATLYHTRDLATDKYRLEKYSPDLIINEVGIEQKLYFEQLFEIEEMLGWYRDGQRIHIGHGLIRFKEGKMSTRKGNVIWMEDILNEAVKKAEKLGSKNKKLAEMVAIGALKYNDLKRDPKTEIVFDWDEILNMQGNSGPYLQYTYARANSVLLKGRTLKNKSAKGSTLTSEELAVLRKLFQFSEIISMSAKNYSPNILCNYLYDLAQKFNSFYNKYKILDTPEVYFRLKLTSAVGGVLKSGLNLLGIETPERM